MKRSIPALREYAEALGFSYYHDDAALFGFNWRLYRGEGSNSIYCGVFSSLDQIENWLAGYDFATRTRAMTRASNSTTSGQVL